MHRRYRMLSMVTVFTVGCGGGAGGEAPLCLEPGDTCNDGLCFNGAANGVCDQDLECRTDPSTTGDCVVFITSDEHDGNLGGLEGADAICQERAHAAGLPGTFKAWLSDSTVSAAERLTHSAVAYIDTRGQLVADDWADLTDGSLERALTIDEVAYDWDTDAGHCGVSIYFARTWTASTIGGASHGPFCDDWTDAGDATGATGYYCYASEAWTDATLSEDTAGCSAPLSLYCLQQ